MQLLTRIPNRHHPQAALQACFQAHKLASNTSDPGHDSDGSSDNVARFSGNLSSAFRTIWDVIPKGFVVFLSLFSWVSASAIDPGLAIPLQIPLSTAQWYGVVAWSSAFACAPAAWATYYHYLKDLRPFPLFLFSFLTGLVTVVLPLDADNPKGGAQLTFLSDVL